MTVLFLLSVSSLLIFLIFSAILFHTLNSIKEIEPPKNEFAGISIVVAAKNEKKNIGNLLNSFINLDYPKDKFEIIIVDDNSVDNTTAIVNSYSKKISNMKIISAAGKKIPAKKGALEIGIDASAFDYIVMTDADCEVPAKWLKYFSNKFETGSQFVFGNIIYTNEKKSFVGFFQQYENFRSKFLYFATAKLNFPYSAGGANFGFQKKAYIKLGGYSQISKTFSGNDDLLIQMAHKHNLKIGFIVEQAATVKTEALTNFTALLRTKARHTSASYYYSITTKFFLAIWHFSNLLSLFSVLLIPASSIFLLPFLVKIIIDTLFTAQFCEMFGYRFNIFQSIIFQIIYEVLIVFNFFNGFRFIKRWK